MDYQQKTVGDHIIIGNDGCLKVEVRKDDNDMIFSKTPYMRIFRGDEYESSEQRAKITIQNPSYLTREWTMDKNDIEELNTMMRSGKKFSSPWFRVVMEASREFLKNQKEGYECDDINFLEIRDSDPPDFMTLVETEV